MFVTGSFIEPVQSTPRTPLKCYRNRPIVLPTSRSSRWYASSFAVRAVSSVALFHLIEPFYKPGWNYSAHYAVFHPRISSYLYTPYSQRSVPKHLNPYSSAHVLEHASLHHSSYTLCLYVSYTGDTTIVSPKHSSSAVCVVVTQYVWGRNNFLSIRWMFQAWVC